MSKNSSKAERKAMVREWKKGEVRRSFFDGGKETAGRWIASRLCLLAGILLLAYAGTVHGLNAWARSWPTTEGVILDSGVRAEEAWFQGKHRYSGPRMVYLPWVHYEYSWKGKILQGRRQWVSDLFLGQNLPETARGEISSYPKGEAVTLRVCPRWPSYAVLKTHGYDGILVPLIAGIMALLLAAVIHFTVDRGPPKGSKN